MKSLIKKINVFFTDVYKELSKVSWPTRASVINHTLIVLLSAAIVMGVTSGLDFGLSNAFKLFLSIKK